MGLEIDKVECLRDVYRLNKYKLDDRFVINDGKKHPFVIICPGGGYNLVCSYVEGVPVAKKLNEFGYSAFIVFYRVKRLARYPYPQDDLARAVRMILAQKEKYHLEGNYSLIGFSAGGHLASSFCTKNMGYEKYQLPKPKALILGYPVTSMEKNISHESTRARHVGENASSILEKECSVYFHVNQDFPKTFIATGTMDCDVKIENTKLLEEALKNAGVQNKVVWLEGLGHGFGTAKGTIGEAWLDQAVAFLNDN